MLFTLLAILVALGETALAVFVAARAWHMRSSQLFVYFAASIIIVVIAAIVRDFAPTPEQAYAPLAVLVVGVGVYIWLLMLLLSALFIPEWWQGSRPIIWISLPYLLSTFALALDLALGLGWFVNGARLDGLYRLNYIQPSAGVLILSSLIGQLFNFVILAVAFRRRHYRHLRLAIVLLGLGMATSIALASSAGQFSPLARVISLVQTLPIVAALSYAILGTQLFVPTRAALDLALQALGEGVAVVDNEGLVIFANPQATGLGLALGQPLDRQLLAASSDKVGAAELVGERERSEAMTTRNLSFGARQIEITLTPVRDAQGQRRSTLVLGRDVTTLTQRTQQLEHERAQLSAALSKLETEQHERELLASTVRALALPLIPVLTGVIVLPLIGDFTGQRSDEFINVLLRGIERERADTVLLDITGVALLDSTGAQGLLSGVRAAALLGARCVLVGVRPEVAQALVALGLGLDEVTTAQTLQQAVAERMRLGAQALA